LQVGKIQDIAFKVTASKDIGECCGIWEVVIKGVVVSKLKVKFVVTFDGL
jgi:hypothetical protein